MNKKYEYIFWALEYRGFFNWISDEQYLKLRYKMALGQRLNLDNPQTFNEKLQWLKLHDHNPLYTTLVDKYAVKEYIKERLGEEYVIPLVGGPWKNANEIDFGLLPNQFVLKCTHDSGSVIICRDKKSFEIKAAVKKLNKALKHNFYYGGREWPYKNVKPQIIAEKYMEDESTDEQMDYNLICFDSRVKVACMRADRFSDNSYALGLHDTSVNINVNSMGLTDYKFYCFNGEVKCLYVSTGLEHHETARRSFLTPEWEFAPFSRSDYMPYDELPNKPVNYDKMLIIAGYLSKGFPFLRVDLFEMGGQIYFSELTFYPCCGYMPFVPEEWDLKLGNELSLPL